MKNFWKENKTGILTVTTLLLVLFLALAREPSAALTSSPYGWLVVRLGVLVFAAVMGLITYSKYEKIIINKDSIKWSLWWVIATQIMTSFYISEWFSNGF